LKPQLSVWSMSKLSIAWSYMLHIEGEKSSLLLNRFLGLFLFVSFLEFS
jgi:NET1-associated nuclear protein 1 (U3 small nucleolar RNA-associated protein 17)